jgi:hypothetical protein
MSIDSRLREGLQRSMSTITTDPEECLPHTRRQGRRRVIIRRAFTSVAVTAVIVVAAMIAPAVLGALRGERHEPISSPSMLSIVGNYVVRLTPSDVGGSGVPQSAGTWVLKLQGDGVLQLAPLRNGNLGGGTSQYQLSGNDFITTALASASCQGVGTYTWSRSGSAVTFIVVSDSCALRVAVFSSRPWRAT